MIECRAFRNPQQRSIDVYVWDGNCVVDPMKIIMRTVVDGDMPAFPTLRLRDEEAQYLFDQLYAAGMRLNQADIPAQLKAMTSHLDDMRAIVAKTLEIELK